jgi:hypothetical protein
MATQNDVITTVEKPKGKVTDDTTALDIAEQELFEEEGDTGTVIVSGILSNHDYNADLTGTQRIRIFDEMRLGDASVRAALQAVKLPIQKTEWYIKPASDEKSHIEQKEFIQQQLLENPNFSWNVLLRQVLTMCDYGNSVFEKVFEPIPDGKYKGKIGWKKFGHRLSKTILRWTEADGVTPGIEQLLPAGKTNDNGVRKTMVSIPKWKLLYFINDLEGSNFEGISLLRSAYKHWYLKETYYKIDAIAAERQGLGVVVIHSPKTASPQERARARVIAKNMRANSELHADLPQGFTMEIMDMKANGLKEVKDMVAHHDREIAKAVLAQFMELGAQSSSGSYALGATQEDFFYLGLEYLASILQEEFQRNAIKELIDLNYGIQEQYPTLEHGQIGAVNYEAIAKSLQQLNAAGVITPDKELERYIRQAMNLPEAVYIEELEGGKDGKSKSGLDIDPISGMPIRPMPEGPVDPKTGKPLPNPKPEGVDPKKNAPRKPLQASEEEVITQFLSEIREFSEDVEREIHARKQNQS